jgi:predicted amidohydrolase
MKTRIYAVQNDIVWEDKAANFVRVRELLAEAKPQQQSLIVLPEMFATGFSKDLNTTREADSSETVAFISQLAAEYQCCVVGGLVGAADGVPLGKNEALAVAPDGSLLARYAKVQPFTGGDEHLVHQPGNRVVTFAWRGLCIAPLICYDLRFPELAREAVRQGADVLIYIASWPVKRAQHWVTLLQARAIENLAWVIGVNRCGTDPSFSYPGRSLVIDPHGNILADAADREGVLESCVDLDVVQQWRSDFPALRDMRPL